MNTDSNPYCFYVIFADKIYEDDYVELLLSAHVRTLFTHARLRVYTYVGYTTC